METTILRFEIGTFHFKSCLEDLGGSGGGSKDAKPSLAWCRQREKRSCSNAWRLTP